MFLTNIDAHMAEDLLPSVQKDLTLVASTLDGRFLEAGNTLATSIEAIDRIVAALDGVTGALDEHAAGAAVRDLRAVAARLAALPDAQAVRDGQLLNVTNRTGLLREQVMVMHQTLQVLRIYGVNVKIAASGADEFVGFIDRMTVTLGAGEEELGAFLATLKELDASTAGAQQAERILRAEAGKVVPMVPRSLASDVGELQAHLATVAGAAQRVSVIAREIQGRVAVVLGALQVGDRVRQRLEHVASSLQMLEGRGGREADAAADGAVVGHVCRLLAAQLEACEAEFEEGTTLLLTSLRALGPDTVRLLALIDEEGNDDGRTFLHRLERGITEVERLTTQLHEADLRSGGMLDTIAASLDALSTRLDMLRAMRIDVQTIAVNTRLMCRRYGDTGKAVAVIASEVDRAASQLGSALECVIRPIEELRETSATMQDAQRAASDLDAGEALSRSLDVIRQGCRRSEAGVASGRDDAQQVIDLIERVSGRLSEELTFSAGMRQAQAALLAAAGPEGSLPEAADATLRDMLVAIARLYTMAEERDVHAAFLLPGMAPMTAVAAEDCADEEDDGLF